MKPNQVYKLQTVLTIVMYTFMVPQLSETQRGVEYEVYAVYSPRTYTYLTMGVGGFCAT